MTDSEFKWCDFTAGCIAGFVGTVIGHPMDTIKVRQQTLGSGKMVEISKNTLKYEGIRGFYKGMLFPALTAGALNSIFFGVYGNTLQTCETLRKSSDFKRTCAEGMQPPYPYWHLDVYLSGCSAGFAQVLFGCPIDLIKIKLQSQTGNKQFHWAQHHESGYTGPFDCIKQMYREHGIRGFYRAFPAMVCRDMPTFGIYVLTYEHLLSVGRPASDHSPNYSIARQIVAGGLAGVVSWQVVVPLDVVKSRLQADNPLNPAYKGMVDCFIKSYRNDGISVFGRGFWMISIRAFAVNSGVFVAFEWCLHACSKVTTAT